jgi:hypothetical protein
MRPERERARREREMAFFARLVQISFFFCSTFHGVDVAFFEGGSKLVPRPCVVGLLPGPWGGSEREPGRSGRPAIFIHQTLQFQY